VVQLGAIAEYVDKRPGDTLVNQPTKLRHRFHDRQGARLVEWDNRDAYTNRWGLFRNPLPPASEHAVFCDIRNDGRLESKEVLGPRFDEVGPDVRRDFLQEFGPLAERHNPIVRRVVRRTRPMLEERGLLKRIGVIAHPRAGDGLPSVLFDGGGLIMTLAFNAAYEAAEAFSRLYAARRPGAGFLKTILLRRIGSSARAGLETARHFLGRIDIPLPEEEIGDEGLPTDDTPPDPQEVDLLREVERNLAAVVGGADTDPKVQVILHYLGERKDGALHYAS
jgi:DNA-binding Lrp family transcriptional regulator